MFVVFGSGEMALQLFLLVACLGLGLVHGQDLSPYRPYPTITGAQQRELELSQNPALLELAAREGERVLIEIRSAEQTAIVQEGVNALIDCFPWLSRFPGGTTRWFIEDLDEFGRPLGELNVKILARAMIITLYATNHSIMYLADFLFCFGGTHFVGTCYPSLEKYCGDHNNLILLYTNAIMVATAVGFTFTSYQW